LLGTGRRGEPEIKKGKGAHEGKKRPTLKRSQKLLAHQGKKDREKEGTRRKTASNFVRCRIRRGKKELVYSLKLQKTTAESPRKKGDKPPAQAQTGRSPVATRRGRREGAVAIHLREVVIQFREGLGVEGN